MSYEIHITSIATPKDIKKYKEVAECYGWKTSCIDGDPILGEGVKFYFTTHEKQMDVAQSRMNQLHYVLNNMKAPVLRKKIERIVLDEVYYEKV
jgi:hypothetical protein